MYSLWAGLGIAVAALGVWLCLVSYYLWKQMQLSKSISPDEHTKKITDSWERKFATFQVVLEELDRRNVSLQKNFKELAKQRLEDIERVELIRYNPYKDMGGDQSFSFVMLNGKLNGVILTSLHSRAGTRVYIRRITKGESDVELTKEEKEILKKAVEQV